MSAKTAAVAYPLLVLSQPDLGDEERGGAYLQVKVYAQLCGLEGDLLAQGKQKGRAEAEAEHRKRPVLVSPDGGPNVQLVSPIGVRPGRR